MTVLTATSQAQADSLIPKLVDGDTLKLVGNFGPWRPSGRKFATGVTFDCSAATLTDIYTGGWAGVTWQGGKWKVGPKYSTALRDEGSQKCRYENLAIDGTDPAAQHWAFALWLNGGSDAVVANPTINGVPNGMMLNNLDGVQVLGGSITEVGSDAIQFADCNIVIDGATIDKLNPQAGDHPDMIQGRSTAGKPRRNATIRNVKGTGSGQGIFIGPDAGSDGPGVVTVENCIIKGGFVRAISVANAVKSIVTGNDVSTLDGSQYQATILCPASDGNNVRSKNIVRAATLSNGSAAKEIRDADYVAPAPAKSAPRTMTIDAMTVGGVTYAGTLTEKLV